ncbi:MAG: hypothetical protein ACRDWD_09760 [Acidimicrobiia bacterium]
MLDRLSMPEDDPDTYPSYRPRPVDRDGRTWTDTFTLIADLQRAELEVWRDAALLEVDVAEIRDWLEQHGDDMDASERDTLERLHLATERARERAQRSSDPRLTASGLEQKALDPRARLDEIEKQRHELIGRVGKASSHPTPKVGGELQRREVSRPLYDEVDLTVASEKTSDGSAVHGSRHHVMDPRAHLAKVRVAGSNPVVRSILWRHSGRGGLDSRSSV